jgi:hypothetical protein
MNEHGRSDENWRFGELGRGLLLAAARSLMRAPAIGILSAVLTAFVLSPAAADPPTRSPRASLVQVLQGGRQALVLDRTTSEYQVVKLGDELQGYRVTELEDDQIVLASPSAPERSFVLPLVGLPVAPPAVVAPDASRAPGAAAAPDAATSAPEAAASDAAPAASKPRASARARGRRGARLPAAPPAPTAGVPGADDLGPLGDRSDDLGPVTDDADVLGPIESDRGASGAAGSTLDGFGATTGDVGRDPDAEGLSSDQPGAATGGPPTEAGPAPAAPLDGADDPTGGDVIDPYAAPGPGSIPSVIAPPASRGPGSPPPARSRGADRRSSGDLAQDADGRRGPSDLDPEDLDGDLGPASPVGPDGASAERGDDLGPSSGADDLGRSSGADDLGPPSGADDLGPLGGADDLGPSSGAGDLGPLGGADDLGPSSGAGDLGPLGGAATDDLGAPSGAGDLGPLGGAATDDPGARGADDLGPSGADSISGADRGAVRAPEPGAGSLPPPVGGIAPRGSKPPRAAPPDSDLRVVSRRELDDAMSDFSALARQIQIEPAEGGGVRVLAIAGRSFFARLGIQTGDVIHRVAGQPIDTVDGAAGAYAVLASSRSVTVELERRGAPVRLRYRLTR